MAQAPKTFPKRMIPRAYGIWREDMNLQRAGMHLDSADTAGVASFMTTQFARPGSDEFGWNEDRAILGMFLNEPATESILKRKDLSVVQIITEEMQARESLYSGYKTAGGPELEAFMAEFCLPDGSLIDLRHEPHEKLFLGNEGHHRAMRALFDAHVDCLAAVPAKKFTTLIPVIPAIFETIDDLMIYQARGNASDGKQNRLTKKDICKIAINVYMTVPSGNQFALMIGEVTPRRSTGQEVDDGSTEISAKNAGSTAVFAWNVAVLHHRFKRLNVLGCITADPKHVDFVDLNSLSVNPNPDWMKSVPTILQLSDPEQARKYVNKQQNPTPIVAEAVAFGKNRVEVGTGPGFWSEEDVVAWWNTRKKNRFNGKPIPSANVVKRPVDSKMVEKYAKDGQNQVAKLVGLAMLNTVDSNEVTKDAEILINSAAFNDFIDAAFDISKTTYRNKVKEFLLNLGAAVALIPTGEVTDNTVNTVLDDCLQLTKSLSTPKTVPVKQETAKVAKK